MNNLSKKIIQKLEFKINSKAFKKRLLNFTRLLRFIMNE